MTKAEGVRGVFLQYFLFLKKKDQQKVQRYDLGYDGNFKNSFVEKTGL